MIYFKPKTLIKFGLNLSFKSLTKFVFLNKLILSDNFFFSILDLKLLLYKLLNYYLFIQIYKKNLKTKRILLFIDGTSDKKLKLLNKKYVLNYNYFYINKNTWLPIFEKNLQINKINFIIFWSYSSFFLKLNLSYLNVPFFFFK